MALCDVLEPWAPLFWRSAQSSGNHLLGNAEMTNCGFPKSAFRINIVHLNYHVIIVLTQCIQL